MAEVAGEVQRGGDVVEQLFLAGDVPALDVEERIALALGERLERARLEVRRQEPHAAALGFEQGLQRLEGHGGS
ncbi:hypothetical protein D3C83_142070 [compost metagenome]